MVHKIIETTRHDYDPVNKYIDEKVRLRRTKSIWKNTRSAALGLLALAFFNFSRICLYIFKKPHPLAKYKDEIISNNDEVDKYNNKIDDMKKIEEKNKTYQTIQIQKKTKRNRTIRK